MQHSVILGRGMMNSGGGSFFSKTQEEKEKRNKQTKVKRKVSPDDKSFRLMCVLIIQMSIIFVPWDWTRRQGKLLAYDPSTRKIALPASALG